MKRMPITAHQARYALRVATKAVKTGSEIVRKAIPVVTALAVAVREIRRLLK